MAFYVLILKEKEDEIGVTYRFGAHEDRLGSLWIVEEEFRSQNSGAEPETLRLRSESRRDSKILATAPLSMTR